MRSSGRGQRVDVAVAGGGFVGLTLALALARGGVRVVVIEASPAGAMATSPRPIAIAEGSRRVLESLGTWNALAACASPIRAIHVSDRGRFGFARLNARDCGVEALGYVSEAGRVAAALEGAVAAMDGVDRLQPCTVQGIDVCDDAVIVSCAAADSTDSPLVIAAKLLVAADGGQSAVRSLSGIGARERDWRQSALTATVTPRLPHDGVAYERFTGNGPLALLPLARRRCGLVWTLPRDEAESMMALDDAAFLEALTRAFGTRLGGFEESGPRTCHRLFSVHSRESVKRRIALAGNAANHLHPVAGQGLNLGVRDAAALAEVVVEAVRRGGDPGDMTSLKRYAEWRRRDQWSTSRFTEGLVRLFSNDIVPLAVLRDAGLLGLDSFAFLKRSLARRAMGLAGRSPRLARGLPL